MTSRIMELSKTANENGSCVVYVMSRDQRVDDNHALLEAQSEALKYKLPLIVAFNVLISSGHRHREHFEFMLDGLKEVTQDLKTKNIPFILSIGRMSPNIAKLIQDLSPRAVFFDFSPLRGPRAYQKSVAARASCRVAVVDTHNVIPAWVVSDKEEFAAHTIRRKIHKNINDWAKDPPQLMKHPYEYKQVLVSATWEDVSSIIEKLPTNGTNHGFQSGSKAARKVLSQFIDSGIASYAEGRNNALADAQSNLSPYLHYGQISALRVLLEVLDSTAHPPQIFTSYKMPSHAGNPTKNDGIDSFIEELIVRKELSDNFCLYNVHYDSLQGARDWAKDSLSKHSSDTRDFLYTKKQLDAAKTHDELWNAAQNQLRKSGKIHGYMRMYWAKKILEWTDSPQTAIKIAIELNDTYHLDGGDPNGYVGIMWSIAGVHDRPWFNHPIYGTIRYMARSGADKKFDTKKYISHWNDL